MVSKIIAANHKMNMSTAEYEKFFKTLEEMDIKNSGNKSIVYVPYPYLFVKNAYHPQCMIGAQNVSKYTEGAHTGEVSIKMLKDLGCDAVLLGHSEVRRLGETDEDINAKIRLTLDNPMHVTLCVGETLEEKNRGDTLTAIDRQLYSALNNLPFDDYDGMIVDAIAYEPMWLDEVSFTPSLDDIKEVADHINKVINLIAGYAIPILYGGNVNGTNASSILSIPNISGVLIGVNSLDAYKYGSIVKGEYE